MPTRRAYAVDQHGDLAAVGRTIDSAVVASDIRTATDDSLNALARTEAKNISVSP